MTAAKLSLLLLAVSSVAVVAFSLTTTVGCAELTPPKLPDPSGCGQNKYLCHAKEVGDVCCFRDTEDCHPRGCAYNGGTGAAHDAGGDR